MRTESKPLGTLLLLCLVQFATAGLPDCRYLNPLLCLSASLLHSRLLHHTQDERQGVQSVSASSPIWPSWLTVRLADPKEVAEHAKEDSAWLIVDNGSVSGAAILLICPDECLYAEYTT